ncbi:MAG: sensor histidine kinase [Ruminiclostridium sp.]
MRITVPVSRLIKHMNEVENGNFDVEFKTQSIDEIVKLGDFFNNMVRRLKDLFEEIQSVQRLKRDAELNALIYQINPHLQRILESNLLQINFRSHGKSRL